MSKNHNYTSHYQNQRVVGTPEETPVKTPVENEVVEEPIAEEITVEEVITEVAARTEVEESVEEVVETPSKVGVVTGCEKLRVRKGPNVTADVICEIAKSTAVIIDDESSSNDFYKVCTESGVEGFCMKKFITVKS